MDADHQISLQYWQVMENLKAKTISSLFWKLMERGGNAVVSLVVQIILARLLSPDDFGMLAIIIVFLNIGAVFVQSGLNSALIQTPDATENDYSTVFWTCFFIAVVLYFGIFLFAPVIGDFYSSPELVWPLRGISLLLLINAYNSIQVAKVTRDLELKKTFYATIASVTISGFIGIFWSGRLGVGCSTVIIPICELRCAPTPDFVASKVSVFIKKGKRAFWFRVETVSFWSAEYDLSKPIELNYW